MFTNSKNKFALLLLSALLFLCHSLLSQTHEGHNDNKPQILENPVKQTKQVKDTKNGKEVKTIPTKDSIETKEVKETKEINPKPIETLSPESPDRIDKPKEVKEDTLSNPHSHHGPLATPAGLMLPHVQKTNDWMVDYLYMQMSMQTLYNGSNKADAGNYLAGIQYNPTVGTIPSSQASTGIVHNHTGTTTTASTAPDPFPSYYIASLNPNPYRYMSMPVSMNMEMTMISLMKNINDKMAIMVMLPYLNNSMQMLSGNLEKSFMRTQGVGDIGITLSYKFIEKEAHTVNLQFGVTLPTGSIDEKNQMPLMGKIKSPYNMQPGTGTYNTIPGISYVYNKGKFNLGSFAQITLRNGKNDNGYRFGNRYEASLWTSYAVLDWLAPTLRITSTKWDNISGADSSLDPTMDPQNDPNRQGGRRIDLLAGVNFYFPSISEKMKAGLEFGKPAYQHLNGPQLGANTLFNFRFQAIF